MYLFPFQEAINIRQENPPGGSSLQRSPHQRGGWGQGGPFQWGGACQHGLPELWVGHIWMVLSPQRLWPVVPPHRGVFLSIQTFSFNVLSHYHSNFYLKLIFLRILINFSFSFFAGHEEAGKDRRAEEMCSIPGARWTPGAGVDLGRYPMSQLVDLMAARVQKGDDSALPSGVPSVEGWQSSSPSEQALKRPHCAPTMITLVALKEEEVTSQGAPLPSGPSKAITDPLGSSTLPMTPQRGPLIPCHVPQLALPARSFKWVNLKGSGKMYMCGQCEKNTSKWDSLVSHYLQEHLVVCLVCTQCGMSYLDPLKFCLHGRGIHNPLFY